MPHEGHWCSAGYMSEGTEFVLPENDAQAIKLLESSILGSSLKIVDLSRSSFFEQAYARITGLNKTPTLIVANKKYKGLEKIKGFLDRSKIH